MKNLEAEGGGGGGMKQELSCFLSISYDSIFYHFYCFFRKVSLKPLPATNVKMPSFLLHTLG